MSGIETVHKIVEKFEVQDAEKTERVFDKIARSLEGKLGKGAGNAVRKVGDVVDKVGDKFGIFGKQAAGGAGAAGEGLGGMEAALGGVSKGAMALGVAGVVAYGAFKVITAGARMAWGALKGITDLALEKNLPFDAMGDKLTGQITTLTAFSKIEDPIKRYNKSQEAANALLGEFHGVAMKVAEPLEKINALGDKVQVFWTALGKSQLDVLEMTEATASAAKVLGEDLDRAGDSVFRLLRTGKAGKMDPFGMAVAAEAGIKKTDALAVRADKVFKAMKKIGIPVKEIASGTDDNIARWKILSNDVLQRLTLPIYEKIGKAVGGLLDFADKYKDKIEKTITFVSEVTENVWIAAEGAWELFAATATWVDELTGAMDKLEGIANAIKKGTEWARDAGKMAKELADPTKKGGGAVHTRNFADKLFKYMTGLDMDKIKFMGLTDQERPYFLPTDVPNKDIDWEALEKAGIKIDFAKGPDGKSRVRGSEEIKKLLKDIFGNRRPLLEMNVDKIEVDMDLRGEDSDAIMTEFVNELERVGDASMQSAVAGRALAYGPGGSW